MSDRTGELSRREILSGLLGGSALAVLGGKATAAGQARSRVVRVQSGAVWAGDRRDPKVVAAMLLITGTLTFLTYRMGARTKAHGLIRPRDAFVIGLFQAVALIPGISRSGSTIFAGVLCGLERTFAASYSFIASIPAIMGAAAVEWGTNSHHVSSLHLVGGATAFIVGLISLRFLVWTLKRNTFFIFSLYCWLVGLAYLAFF